jgi:sterol desaturase/sphingolipid hydroxylase (fatty acid hydroxylase superfamily)
MPHLTTLEKTELAVIPVIITLTWFAPLGPDVTQRIGGLITAASLLLLLQGFCRDVWLWLAARRATVKPTPHYAQCMCVESAVGLTGILAAAGLTAFNFGPLIPVSQAGLTSGTAAVLVAGFLLKDFVFEWSPWKIHRAKNHAALHFRWKR